MKDYKGAVIATLLLLLPVFAMAAQTGSALKADVVRKEPYADAQKAGDLTRGEKLEIMGKKGAWLNIKTARTRGWVRLLSVKIGAAGNANQVKGALDVATGRAGTGKVVATTGVRGLNEEDLKNAKYNEGELKKMESYVQTSRQAAQFAKSGGLRAVALNYLPEAQTGGESP